MPASAPRPPRAAAPTRAAAGLALILALAGPAAPVAADPAGPVGALPQPLAAAALAAPVARVFAPAGLALGGHDPVAYFAEGRAVPGLPGLALRWRGAVWRFASPANLAAFEANPTAFAPEFGGYCAFAMSRGAALPGDPQAFAVVDGRLYLAHNRDVLRLFVADPAPVIEAAHRLWPALRR